MQEEAPKSFRLHLGLFGRRNVGKSSLLNALTRQQVSIVSDVPGTTTDPVEKAMELLPLGPVLFIDTGGLDDEGGLGFQRVAAAAKIWDRTDFALIVSDGAWGGDEEKLVAELTRREIPFFIAMNKADAAPLGAEVRAKLEAAHRSFLEVSAATGQGIDELRQALIDHAPEKYVDPPSILSDLVGPGEMAVLVVPIDKEAPKGRLIMPQVQSIRDLLDSDAMALVVKERELKVALERLAKPPKLVVTDSQAFLKAAADTPKGVKLTSFSILFARLKGDLVEQAKGARAIGRLKPGDRVLIAEACSHKPICEDIGRVKIPRWLTQFVGGGLIFETVAGYDFPEDLSPYSLVIHCGACVWNRRAMMSRVRRCREAGVPITNYGLAIAESLGILERALEPFPAALDAYQQEGRKHA